MTPDVRESWDIYFMKISLQVASRSTCDRKHIGAVLVRERMILSTGYNGSIRGLAHCSEVGHLIEGNHCVRTIHAEMNAIAQAARNGINTNQSELYVTASPCWSCFRVLINAGITKIVYGELMVFDERVFKTSEQLKIPLFHLTLDNES